MSTHKVKLAVLVSGTGSNLEAIIKATQNPKYPAYIGVVISDQKEALALKKARDDFLDMVERYIEDAKHFHKKGEDVNAFAALNYAHGF